MLILWQVLSPRDQMIITYSGISRKLLLMMRLRNRYQIIPQEPSWKATRASRTCIGPRLWISLRNLLLQNPKHSLTFQALTVIRWDQFSRYITFLNKFQHLCLLHDELLSKSHKLSDSMKINYLEISVSNDKEFSTQSDYQKGITQALKQGASGPTAVLDFKEVLTALMKAAGMRDVAKSQNLESALVPSRNVYTSRRSNLRHRIREHIGNNPYVDWLVHSTETGSPVSTSEANDLIFVNSTETENSDGYETDHDQDDDGPEHGRQAFASDAAYNVYATQRRRRRPRFDPAASFPSDVFKTQPESFKRE